MIRNAGNTFFTDANEFLKKSLHCTGWFIDRHTKFNVTNWRHGTGLVNGHNSLSLVMCTILYWLYIVSALLLPPTSPLLHTLHTLWSPHLAYTCINRTNIRQAVVDIWCLVKQTNVKKVVTQITRKLSLASQFCFVFYRFGRPTLFYLICNSLPDQSFPKVECLWPLAYSGQLLNDNIEQEYIALCNECTQEL